MPHPRTEAGHRRDDEKSEDDFKPSLFQSMIR
jgi:hypothetical protein